MARKRRQITETVAIEVPYEVYRYFDRMAQIKGHSVGQMLLAAAVFGVANESQRLSDLDQRMNRSGRIDSLGQFIPD